MQIDSRSMWHAEKIKNLIFLKIGQNVQVINYNFINFTQVLYILYNFILAPVCSNPQGKSNRELTLAGPILGPCLGLAASDPAPSCPDVSAQLSEMTSSENYGLFLSEWIFISSNENISTLLVYFSVESQVLGKF